MESSLDAIVLPQPGLWTKNQRHRQENSFLVILNGETD